MLSIYFLDNLLLTKSLKKSTILSAALPSHFSGTLPRGTAPFKTLDACRRMSSRLFPTTKFVPISQVTGRSVLLRNVMQGTPRTVASSCKPPLSVITIRAFIFKLRKSRYPSGSVIHKPRGFSVSDKVIAKSKLLYSLPRLRMDRKNDRNLLGNLM